MKIVPALLFAFATVASAQELPKELEPLFAGYSVLDVVSGDLDRKPPDDYIVITEPGDTTEDADPSDIARTLHVVTFTDGKPRIVKSNGKIVQCRACGGMMGDPYVGTTIGKGRFTVSQYGGSSWRWSSAYTFAWSRRDRTWQLVKVETSSFHAAEPENAEDTVHTPPTDFGKIDLADFDPEKYVGVGEK